MTKKFNLDDIDAAISKVADQRSNLGASTNRLEHAYNYNTMTAIISPVCLQFN